MNQLFFAIAPLSLAGFLAVAGGCHSNEPRETDMNFGNYTPLAAAVAKADQVTLYEGLPHPMFEKKLLDEELKNRKTVQHHGFPFYVEPLPLKERDAKELTKLFTDAKSFARFSGYKLCGGFHPDYCIEWHVGNEVYRCLVCFGCHEIKVFGSKSELYCDIANQAYSRFKELLEPYRKNRPKPEAN